MEEMMGDRRNSCKSAQLVCYPGIHECTRDAMTLTGKQEKVQVCENNLVRRILGGKRRTGELRVEVVGVENLRRNWRGVV